MRARRDARRRSTIVNASLLGKTQFPPIESASSGSRPSIRYRLLRRGLRSTLRAETVVDVKPDISRNHGAGYRFRRIGISH